MTSIQQSPDDLAFTPAVELARRIRAREVSPVDIVEASLDRIERFEGTVNAFITILAEEARTAAKEAERIVMRRDPGELGALHGIPIVIKDLTPTAGVRTSYGLKQLADNVPDEDAIAWARLKAAGPILLGKTATPPLGAMCVTESLLNGRTNNPWDAARTVGGSSGGSAAAVAAGFSPLANGSDGGASIRVPAGFCGVVGLKPTAGRIPVWPEVSPFESSSAVGPITRTVADSALMLDIMAGPDPSEPYAVPAPAVPFLEGLEGADVAGKRLAFAVEGFGPVEPDVVDSLTTLARHLEHRGAHVEFVSVELPDLIQYFYDYWAAVMGPELFESARELAAYPPLMRWLDYSQKMNVSQYLDASFTRRVQIRTALVGVLREHDFLITPTTTRVAFPHPDRDLLGPSHILGQPVREPAIDFARFTDPPSQANLPALSIPCGFSAEGLPYGAQIVGPHAADGPVLQLGSAIEQSLNLLHRRPLSA